MEDEAFAVVCDDECIDCPHLTFIEGDPACQIIVDYIERTEQEWTTKLTCSH